MSKILKNTTASAILISDTGVSIPASPGTYTIQIMDYLLWAASADVVTQITSGALIVNDGTSDLSVTDGIAYIAYPDHAKGVRFDNSTNGFVAQEVQTAIEESKNKIREVATDPVGAVAEDTWVLRTEHIGTPIGLLLCLTRTFSTYQLSYKTQSGTIVRTDLA